MNKPVYESDPDAAPDKGAFEVQIEAFEDEGARWELPLEEVGRFQFGLDACRATPGELAQLEAARDRFDHELVIATREGDPGLFALTEELLAERGLGPYRGRWFAIPSCSPTRGRSRPGRNT